MYFILYFFQSLPSQDMAHETDYEKKFKNECGLWRNLRKPRNPYQLTPVYGI